MTKEENSLTLDEVQFGTSWPVYPLRVKENKILYKTNSKQYERNALRVSKC